VRLRLVDASTGLDPLQTTLVVLGFVVIAGVFFWLLDALLAWATRYLTGQGA